MRTMIIKAAITTLLSFAMWIPVASAQRAPSPALLLARVCVSEAGWNCWDNGDGLGIHEVFLRGAERHGMSYAGFARSYSSAAGRERTHLSERMRWVRELAADGSAPPSWPAHRYIRREGRVEVRPSIPWSHYREAWLAVLARAEQVVRDYTLTNIVDWRVCEAPVHDWGGAMDRERATRIGLVEVECGDTRNDFYARPSLIADRD